MVSATGNGLGQIQKQTITGTGIDINSGIERRDRPAPNCFVVLVLVL